MDESVRLDVGVELFILFLLDSLYTETVSGDVMTF